MEWTDFWSFQIRASPLSGAMKFLPGRLTPCYWHDGQLTFLATWKVWCTTRRGTVEKIYFRFWDLNRSSGLSNNFPRITRTYLWRKRKGIVWCSQTWSQARSCQAIIKASMKTTSNYLMTGKHPLWPDDSFFFTKQQWAQESRTPNSLCHTRGRETSVLLDWEWSWFQAQLGPMQYDNAYKDDWRKPILVIMILF